MKAPRTLVAIALSLCFTAAAGAACIPSGNQTAIQAALDVGGNVVLCQNAIFNITAPLRITKAGTQLYTEFQPTGGTRATIRVASSALTNAIHALDVPNVTIRNIRVDGARPTYGYVRTNSDALILVGGNAPGAKVLYVEASSPAAGAHWRSSSAIPAGTARSGPAAVREPPWRTTTSTTPVRSRRPATIGRTASASPA